MASAARERSLRLDVRAGKRRKEITKRFVDVVAASFLLLLVLPVLVLCALAVKLESRGPLFYRARRVGRNGRDLHMLKFRKMHVDAAGPALTAPNDDRFTRVGRVLAATKLDELPQLFNVLKGDMSLVGPRPEDPIFVLLHAGAYDQILTVRPGVTGLSQLAFAKESRVLKAESRVDDYVERILPQKIRIDILYAQRASLVTDLRILMWTVAAVWLRHDIAVNRSSGAITLRSRPAGGELARETEPVIEPASLEVV